MSFRSELATRDFIYIIMDLVPGEELLTLIQRERALPEDQARRIFGQLMGAVAFAHARGWAHRDLKPVKALFSRPIPPSFSVLARARLWCLGARMWRVNLPRGVKSIPNPRLTPHILVPSCRRPYNKASEWPGVNGGGKGGPVQLGVNGSTSPLAAIQAGYETGQAQPGYFVSESGATTMSSFESMSATLSKENWGLHSKPFYERNYPCERWIYSYFRTIDLNQTGAAPFQRQVRDL